MPDFSLQDASSSFVPQTDPTAAPPDAGELASILGYAPQPSTQGPVTSPDQDTGVSSYQSQPQPSPSALAPSKSLAVGAKIGAAGYNPAANAAIQKGPHAAMDRQMAADRAQVGSEYAPIQEEQRAATQTAISAELEASKIESKKATVVAEAKTNIANSTREFMQKEQAAMENSHVESQTAISNYRAAIADYAASSINPSQLWDNAGREGQMGIVATAFMHDFLAAKGIQSSGMDSINKAIQNNISAQLDNQRKKLDVASGFKQIWDMQRAQSATDAEARQRMHGFYLSAMSNQIEGQVGQYDSQLALVKGQALKAQFLQEQMKNDMAVQQHIDTAAQQRATDRVHMYTAELAASSAKTTAEAHVKAAEIAANAKNATSPLAGVLFDTSQSGKNTAIRRFLPDMKPEDITKHKDQAANVTNTVGNIEKLIDLQDQISKAPPDIGVEAFKRMQSEERRTAELVRNVTKMGIIYDNSGKQINEQEVKLYDEIVSKKDWFLNGDNIRTLGTLAKMMLDKENNVLRGISTEILPGDPAYGATSGSKGLDQGNDALTNIQSQPGAGRHVNGEAENIYKQITSPDSGEPAVDKGGIGNKIGSAIGVSTPKNLETGSGLSNKEWTDLSSYKAFLKATPDVAAGSAQDVPDKAFSGVVSLGDLAKQGDTVAQRELQELATGNSGLASWYARWELGQLGGK